MIGCSIHGIEVTDDICATILQYTMKNTKVQTLDPRSNLTEMS